MNEKLDMQSPDALLANCMSPSATSDASNQLKSDWLAAKQIFLQALDLPKGSRDKYVQLACGNGTMAAQVHELLRWHEHDAEFLLPIVPLTSTTDSTCELRNPNRGYDPESLQGSQIGGFVLGRILGQGSMGTVYEAQQIDPDRPVAFKILRADSAFVGLERRLVLEASILARLDHPGIARIYSAGTLEVGNMARPWFAMELIRGPTLLEYVRESSLVRRQRLELLARLCDAVQHAHQHNIIHRDLKPENILIRTCDAGSQLEHNHQPVVLDFGVARLSTPFAVLTRSTAAGQLIGTLAYMSPEQLSGNPELVDARSDVYALGVIGYQLLAGKAPHERDSSSIMEILQRAVTEQPKRLGDLDGSLRGELETLFYKAVQPDADQRYQSVAEFSSDIRAYLNYQPIRAKPATLWYRTGKFVRRNRILVGGIATTFLALTIGLLAYSREAYRAQQAELQSRQAALNAQYEADKAKAINEFLTNDFMMRLLEAAHASQASSRVSAIDLASQASNNVASTYVGKPILEAAIRNELGTIFYNLHAANESAEQFELALNLWSETLGSDHVDTLKAVNNLGQSRMLQGRPEEAKLLYERALAGRIARLGENHSASAATMSNLAEVLRSSGDLDQAESYQERALHIMLRSLGRHHRDTITLMANYGSTLVKTGRVDEGLQWHHQAYESGRQGLGDNHIITLHAGSRLAQTLLANEQPEQAISILQVVLHGMENIFGQKSLETVTPLRILARAQLALNDQEGAIASLESAKLTALGHGDRGRKLVDRISHELKVAKSQSSQRQPED